ncbi:3317_t:CDS:1, partial [Funneliformis caledonium]
IEYSSLSKTSSFNVTTAKDITLTSNTNMTLNTADTALIAANTISDADVNVILTADIKLYTLELKN